MSMETPNWLKNVGTENLDEIRKSYKDRLPQDKTREEIEQEKLVTTKNHQKNFTESLSENIHHLKKQSVDTALSQDPWDDTRDDFSSQKTDTIKKEINKNQFLKENLNNPEYFSQN